MSFDPIPASASVAELKTLLEGADVRFIESYGSYSSIYEAICGDHLGSRLGANGDIFVSNALAEARFARSMRQFRQSTDFSPSNLFMEYMDYLKKGGCPEGSIGGYRTHLMQKYASLSNMLDRLAVKAPTADEEAQLGEAAVNARRISAMLDGIQSPNSSDALFLSQMSDVLQDDMLRPYGIALLNSIRWDETPTFNILPIVREVLKGIAEPDIQWPIYLEKYFGESRARDLIAHGLSSDILDYLTKFSGEKDPLVTSLVSILYRGDVSLFTRFVRLLQHQSPQIFEVIVHLAAFRKMSSVRLGLLEKALDIIDDMTFGKITHSNDRELLEQIISLMMYPEGPFKIENDIIILLNKLINVRTIEHIIRGAGHNEGDLEKIPDRILAGSQGNNFVIAMLAGVRDLYDRHMRTDGPSSISEIHIDDVAKILQTYLLHAAAIQPLNAIRAYLIESAMDLLQSDYFGEHRDSPWFFTTPLLDRDEKPFIDNAELSGEEYIENYWLKHFLRDFRDTPVSANEISGFYYTQSSLPRERMPNSYFILINSAPFYTSIYPDKSVMSVIMPYGPFETSAVFGNYSFTSQVSIPGGVAAWVRSGVR